MFLTDEFIIKKLNSLHEHKMAKDIFVPLLKKKGLKGVRFTGGTDEEGIDVEFYEKSSADGSRQYVGIQFKQGDISYSSRGKNGSVKDIKNQAEEAFSKPILEVNSGGCHYLSRFIVATTGEINKDARKMINRAKSQGQQLNITYWDGEDLAEDIREYWEREFIEYFQVSEKQLKSMSEISDSDYIVTSDYIEENYHDIVEKCRKCVKMLSISQKEIVKAFLDYYFRNDSKFISMEDLLYNLETQEDSIRDDLSDMIKINCIKIDEDTISLSGKQKALTELVDHITDEMIDAEEYDSNEKMAEEIFYKLVKF